MSEGFLKAVIKQFEYYKLLGDKTIDLLNEEQLFWMPNETSNSVAIIIKHLHGNMLSRWTDFLTSDGEKETRERDAEFENDRKSKTELQRIWQQGWDCLFNTLHSLTEKDLNKMVYIRNQGCTAEDAIMRQLAHYPYHIGQIIYIGKLIVNENWISLSIPKNASKDYNSEKFSQAKHTAHFTDEILKKKE